MAITEAAWWKHRWRGDQGQAYQFYRSKRINGPCERKCSKTHGSKSMMVECLQCWHVPGTRNRLGTNCNATALANCGYFRGARIGSSTCYDDNCEGPGKYTGYWTKWEKIDQKCVSPDGRCGPRVMGTIRSKRECLPGRNSGETFECPNMSFTQSSQRCVVACGNNPYIYKRSIDDDVNDDDNEDTEDDYDGDDE